MNDDFPLEGNLAGFQKQLADKQNELADIAVDLELARSLALFTQHPDWPKVTASMRLMLDGELFRLKRGRMDLYDLGRRQGRIATLESFLRTSPPSQAEIDSATERVTVLRTEIETLKNLLS